MLKPFENDFFLISIEDNDKHDSHNVRRGDTADGPFSNSNITLSYCFHHPFLSINIKDFKNCTCTGYVIKWARNHAYIIKFKALNH